ncbi:hypothetical protein D9619_003861 [Psilocybe cf. subviscida]|uniref:Uncharacterized protein n=1 Tax=Psilocybe cf. subviscida TaxID=2480587 RepID=A0A8H5ETS7_9AGAR|nr:hypothetical protein D9619_003861 [Psilocybe cf. subviscida]
MLHNLRYRRLRVRLWELTVKVLPSFVNLKSLVMINYTLGATTRTMLSLTQLQPEILQYDSSNDSDDQISLVLSIQRAILHLSIYTSHIQLPADICTTLISIECDIISFGRRAHTRNIKAFALRVNVEDYNHPRTNDKRLSRHALSRVQYLKLPGPCRASLRTLLVELDEILLGQPLRIRGLEMADFLFTDHDEWPLTTIPDFRVISLRFTQTEFPNQYYRMTAALVAFRLFTNLSRLLFWDDKSHIRWAYSRPEDIEKTDETWGHFGLSWLYTPPGPTDLTAKDEAGNRDRRREGGGIGCGGYI